MDQLFEALEALEAACDSETALISHHMPDLEVILAAIRELPADRHPELFERLSRIRMIMDGQLLLHAEEMDRLRVQIRSAQRNSTATSAYRRVAVIQVPQATANAQ